MAETASPASPERIIPPLRDGDRLDREEFHRRYEAMGEGAWAELIDSVVHLDRVPGDYTSGRTRATLSGWIGSYRLHTPNLQAAIHLTTFVDTRNVFQPAVSLMRSDTARQRLGKDGYLRGSPDFACEVREGGDGCVDLNAKRLAYEQAGLGELLVVLLDKPWRVRWLSLVHGAFADVHPDPADGLFKSRVFPGLWLDVDALFADDLQRLSAAVERGCATPEHAAFVERLGQSEA